MEEEAKINPALLKLIKEWIQNRKHGKLVINFFKGGITSVNKQETVKLPE
jgi:hypothetical protein